MKYEEKDLYPHVSCAIEVIPHFSDHLVIPQMETRRTKVSIEPLIDSCGISFHFKFMPIPYKHFVLLDEF